MWKRLRDLEKALPGWSASKTRRHIILIHGETGARVLTAATPSDWRGDKNTLARCRRALRAVKKDH